MPVAVLGPDRRAPGAASRARRHHGQTKSNAASLFTRRHDGAARRRLPRRCSGASAASAFPAQAEGSLIRRADGTVVGSRLIAQKFTRPEYFQPRPSGVDYNAASTGGTNYGPSNPDHLKAVQERLDAVDEAGRRRGRPGAVRDGDGQRRRPRSAHPAGRGRAAGRARRRARAACRVDRVRELIRAHTEPPTFGFLGRARVNVLELNLALDEALGAPRRLKAEGRVSASDETHHDRTRAQISIWDPGIVRQAIVDSFRKLDPRIQFKNPVMFIVEVGSLLTTIIFIQELVGGDGPAAVHRAGGVLAVVHGALRQLRRGDGRGPRQGAGRHAAARRGPRPSRTASTPAARSRRCRRRACARATSSWSRPASSFPATARSSRASRRWTSRRSPASRRRSSASRAATGRPSPAARASSRTGSRCASRPTRATRSSIG